MKKIILLVVLLAMAIPSIAQQVKFSVIGTYTNNGEKIYLKDRLTDKRIDSVVVADGKFSFNGLADKDAFMGVKAENLNWAMDFFNDGTPVIINVNDSTLKGSSQNERLVKYSVEFDSPERELMAKLEKMTEDEMNAKEEEINVMMTQVQEKQLALVNKIFKEERNSLIPLAFSDIYLLDNGLEAYDQLVQEQVVFASHPYLKKIKDNLEEMMHPKDSPKLAFIGQQYTDLEMPDPEGKLHRISDLVGEGKWVLVDFWASWCGPCRVEMPNVLEAYNMYHTKGFEVIGVSLDEKKEAWVKAIANINMPWMQISDLKGWKSAAAPAYKIDLIPDNILIDPQGKIIERGLRGKSLHHHLQKIFGE
jgi:thiol-disulfide isomerase/thioredoxin